MKHFDRIIYPTYSNLNKSKSIFKGSNKLVTSRYNWWSFPIINLNEQLKEISNIYFLFILILQCIPSISLTRGVPSILIPLIIIIITNAIKDAIEDYKKHTSDKNENNQQVCVYSATNMSTCNNNNNNYTNCFIAFIKKFLTNISLFFPIITDKFREETNKVFPNPYVSIYANDFIYKNWGDVLCGDILLLRENDICPVDCIILHANDGRSNVYVDTSNIDGETTLKIKISLNLLQTNTSSQLSSYSICENIKMVMYANDPTDNYNKFNALLVCNEKEYNININNAILRGTLLRNCLFCIVFAVYIGKDTKIALKNDYKYKKITKIEKLLHILVGGLFIFVLSCCIVTTIISYKIKFNNKYSFLAYTGYTELNTNTNLLCRMKYFIVTFLSWILLLSNFIPISLIVTMKLVKAAQILVMQNESKGRIIARCDNLSEELGQIDYIVVDKTGTLTCNIMYLCSLCINGILYATEDMLGFNSMKYRQTLNQYWNSMLNDMSVKSYTANFIKIHNRTNSEAVEKQIFNSMNNIDSILCTIDNNFYIDSPHVRLYNFELMKKLLNFDLQTLLFFINMSINHNCLVDTNKILSYICISPDEEAFIQCSKAYNCVLISRSPSKIILMVNGIPLCFHILQFYPFNSVQKRSSIIVEMDDLSYDFLQNQMKVNVGKFIVFTKGAEEKVYNLCDTNSLGELNGSYQGSMHYAKKFAANCLRTIAYAYKYLLFQDGERIKAIITYHQAMNNEKALDIELRNEIESGLLFQGYSGVSDELIPNVEQTICKLKEANIHIWMATGDNFDSAYNISLKCGLNPAIRKVELADSLNNSTKYRKDQKYFDSNLFFPNYNNSKTISIVLTKHNFSMLNEAKIKPILDNIIETIELSVDDYVVYWDGYVLEHLLHQNLDYYVYYISTLSIGAIFCSVTPQQKADIVKLIHNDVHNDKTKKKNNFYRYFNMAYIRNRVCTYLHAKHNKTVLSIGDGANDCPMIMEADVGVGIIGNEGMEAFNSSDFGVTNFADLQSLLLVHGKYNCIRIINMIMYTIYKNLICIIPTIFFCNFNYFSGQKVFPEYGYQFYNLILTQIPLIIYGIYHVDTEKQSCLNFSYIYKYGQTNANLLKNIIVSGLLAVWHSICCFSIPIISYSNFTVSIMNINYYSISVDRFLNSRNEFWHVSYLIFICVLIVVNLNILLMSVVPSRILVYTSILSSVICLLFLYFLSSLPNKFVETYDTFFRLFSDPIAYVVIIVTCIISLGSSLILVVFYRTFKPNLNDLLIFFETLSNQEQTIRLRVLYECIRQGGNVLISNLNKNIIKRIEENVNNKRSLTKPKIKKLESQKMKSVEMQGIILDKIE